MLLRPKPCLFFIVYLDCSATPGRSIQTQWEDPALLHHGYAKQPNNFNEVKEVHDKETQCSVEHSILQNDSDSLLYTGLPLETLNTLISTLEMFAGSFKMAVRDQILLTLMKLRLNLMIADLSRCFFYVREHGEQGYILLG